MRVVLMGIFDAAPDERLGRQLAFVVCRILDLDDALGGVDLDQGAASGVVVTSFVIIVDKRKGIRK
jgi:hypothetical protein